VENLHVDGVISCSDSRLVGGIAGENNGTIEYCCVTGNVTNNGAGLGAQRAYFKLGDGTALARQITAFNIDFGDGETTSLIENGKWKIDIDTPAGDGFLGR